MKFVRLAVCENNFVATEQVSPIRLHWHREINQIVVGMSDSSVSVFYDPEKSTRGILLPISKQSKRHGTDAFLPHMYFINLRHLCRIVSFSN